MTPNKSRMFRFYVFLRKHWKKLSLILLAAALAGSASFFLIKMMSVRTLCTYRASIDGFVAQHYAVAIALFIACFIANNIVLLPLASVLTVAAGFFFGAIPGIPIAMIAEIAGATTAFALSRSLFGARVQKKYALKLGHFNDVFARYGIYFLLAVRLIPAIPFVFINVAAGLTLVRYRTFLWTTVVGMIPITFIQVFAGAQMQTMGCLSDVFSAKIIALLALLLLLALSPVLVKKYGPA